MKRVRGTIEAIKADLRERFQIAGHGSITRVQEALSLGPSYFRKQWSPTKQRFDYQILFKTLEVLGADSPAFLDSVLGPADIEAGFKSDAAKLRERLRRLPRILILEQKGREASGCSSKNLVAPDELAVLEGLRYDNPKRVLRRTTSLMARANSAQVSPLLGLYASACRVLGRLDEAQMVLGRALELAEKKGDQGALADLLLRAGYVLGDRGHFAAALALAEQASFRFALHCDFTGIGKSFVDRGIWLGCLERNEDALRSFQAALKYFPTEFPPELQKSVVTCRLSIAIIFQRFGDLEKAQKSAQEAQKIATGIGKNFQGKIMFFLGTVARQKGELQSAETYLIEAFDIYGEIAPLDAAMTGVELAQVQIEQGHTATAYETARRMLRLASRLEETPLAAAAITELHRCAATGRNLTLSFLKTVLNQLEKARDNSQKK